MSVLMEFSMFPTDKGESVSHYVSRIIDMIDKSGINYKLTPMGTVIEVESFEDALKILNLSYNQLKDDCNRIYSTIKFDIRKGKSNRLESKQKTVEKILQREVKK